MADLKTQLEIGVDASGVETGVNKAKQSISSLGGAAEAAGTKGAAGLEKMGAAGDQTAKKLDQATKNLIANAQRNLAAIEAGVDANGRMSGRFIESLARQRGADINVLKPYIRDLDEAIAKQKTALGQNAQLLQRGPLAGATTSLGATSFNKPLPSNLSTSLGATAFGEVTAGATKAASAIEGLGKKFDYTALSAKQTTAALRQVPAQLTDIFVSLQGGQAPLTVLLQQGGQLKDVFGGIGPAARALGGYVFSLVNPFTLAATAVGALALAYKQGTEEIDAYAKALILSGNATGTTVSQLNQQAEAISNVVGTQAKAADALAQFAADGNVAAASMQRFAQVAVQMERTTGQAISKTVEQFATLGKEPLQASIKLNETTRFLTTSLYQQIRALEEQGRVAEAAAVAQNGFAAAMESRTGQLTERLGYIEQGWKAVGDAAAGAWSKMLNVGRDIDVGNQLKAAEKRLAELQSGVNLGRGAQITGSDSQVKAAQAEIDNLKEVLALQGRSATAESERIKQTKARIEADKDGLKYQSDSVKLAKEIVRQAQVLRDAGADPQEIAARIAAIKAAAEKKPVGPKRDPQRGIDRSDLAFDLSQIKSEADELVRIYSDAERILEALRSGGLVNEKAYYESRRQFLELETKAKEEALRQEIQRLNQEQALIEARKVRRDDPADAAQKARDTIDNTRKIAEAESRLATLRASASSKAVEFDLREVAAINEKANALLSARQAAEAYFESQNRQQNRSIEAFGQGPREQVFTAGVNQIDDNFAQQERELNNLQILGKLTEDEYEKRLAIIREFQQKSIQSFTEYYAKLLEMQGSAAIGAQQAVKTYIDEAANVAQSTNELVSNSLRGLEDGLTEFLTTGKFKYKEFATSIVADINRIIIKQQIANLLASQIGGGESSLFGGTAGKFLSSLLGSSGASSMSSGAFGIGISGFAMGGAVERGRLVEVNENDGPGELFNVGNRQYLLASQSGRVEPQKATSSQNGQAWTVIQNFTLSGPADRRTQAQIAASAGRGIQTAMARNT